MRRMMLGVLVLTLACGGDDDGATDAGTADAARDTSSAVDGGDSGSDSGDSGDSDSGDSGDSGSGDSGSDSGVDAGFDAAIPDAGPSSERQTPRPLSETEAGNGYYEYLPPLYGTTPSPLLVFWHGIGENGDGEGQLDRVLRGGPPRLIDRDEWPNARPFVVLSPQHSGGGCPTADEIRAFLTYAEGEYDVDPARIYLTGLSCGAIGSWNYLGRFTDEAVAAAVLIAGDGRNAWSRAGCDLGDVAIWGFHGDADGVVAPAGTIDTMTDLIACPDRREAILTVYPGVGHNSWTRTYDLSAGHDIYTWLLGERHPSRP